MCNLSIICPGALLPTAARTTRRDSAGEHARRRPDVDVQAPGLHRPGVSHGTKELGRLSRAQVLPGCCMAGTVPDPQAQPLVLLRQPWRGWTRCDGACGVWRDFVDDRSVESRHSFLEPRTKRSIPPRRSSTVDLS